MKFVHSVEPAGLASVLAHIAVLDKDEWSERWAKSPVDMPVVSVKRRTIWTRQKLSTLARGRSRSLVPIQPR